MYQPDAGFLDAALPTVVVTAKHLTVLSGSLAALVPRGDVVGLHLLKQEVVATDRADTALPLVGLTLLAGGGPCEALDALGPHRS